MQANINTIVSDYADHVETLAANLYKVVIVNLASLGPEHTRLKSEIKSSVMSVLSSDESKACALVIAPVVGCNKLTYDEDAIDAETQAWADDLRDGGPFKVREITLTFDPNTQWSNTRRHAHKAWMCISKKVKDKKLVSHFATGSLWVRGAPCGLVQVAPRHELVDPTWRMQASERGNLSLSQERKQWVTGPSLYAEIGNSLWKGMGLTGKAAAVWIDIMPYDGSLPIAVMSRSSVLGVSQPREMVGSLYWLGDSGRKLAISKYIEKLVLNTMKVKCMSKEYLIDGAPDISAASAPAATTRRVAPTYDEATFKISKPMADKSLPLRKSWVDKWTGTDVPENFRDLFKAAAVTHNAKYNKNGVPYAGEVMKRKAEEQPKEANAVMLKPEADDPTTIEQVEEAHGAVKSKAMEANPLSKLLCADDGTMFLQTGAEDEVFLAEEPLHTFSGEFYIGPDFEKQKKSGSLPKLVAATLETASGNLGNRFGLGGGGQCGAGWVVVGGGGGVHQVLPNAVVCPYSGFALSEASRCSSSRWTAMSIRRCSHSIRSSPSQWRPRAARRRCGSSSTTWKRMGRSWSTWSATASSASSRRAKMTYPPTRSLRQRSVDFGRSLGRGRRPFWALSRPPR